MQKAATVNSCVKCALSSLGCSPVLRGAIDDLAVRIHAVAVHVDECIALCRSPYAYTSIIERIKSSPIASIFYRQLLLTVWSICHLPGRVVKLSRASSNTQDRHRGIACVFEFTTVRCASVYSFVIQDMRQTRSQSYGRWPFRRRSS